MNHLPSFYTSPRDMFAARFSQPNTRAGADPATPSVDVPAAQRPQSASTELLPLIVGKASKPPSSGSGWRRSVLQRSSRTDGVDRSMDEEDVEQHGSRSVGALFAVGGKGQSSGQSAGEGGQNRGQASTPRPHLSAVDCVLQRTVDPPAADNRSHMSGSATSLARRCAEHQLAHGDDAMLSFLRQAVTDLLPAFVRDLGNKLRAIDLDTKTGAHLDSRRPVAEVCDEFLGHLRPLYGRYATGPYLLTDTRLVLCAAQTLLAGEVAHGSDSSARLKRVMYDTVNPLFAILVMSCTRPPASERADGQVVRVERGEEFA